MVTIHLFECFKIFKDGNFIFGFINLHYELELLMVFETKLQNV